MKGIVEPIKDKTQIKKIEEYLKKNSLRNRLIWAIGVNTGLRVSDILNLNVCSVKDKHYIEIIEKKTKKYKKFPLNKKLQKLLKDYLYERNQIYSILEEEPLFVGKQHCRLNRSQVYRFINDVCNKTETKVNVGTHTMRKTFGYHHYRQFNDIALLQKIFNHSSPYITMRYIGITQEELDYSYLKFEL